MKGRRLRVAHRCHKLCIWMRRRWMVWERVGLALIQNLWPGLLFFPARHWTNSGPTCLNVTSRFVALNCLQRHFGLLRGTLKLPALCQQFAFGSCFSQHDLTFRVISCDISHILSFRALSHMTHSCNLVTWLDLGEKNMMVWVKISLVRLRSVCHVTQVQNKRNFN